MNQADLWQKNNTLHPAAQACAEKADRIEPGWTDQALALLARYARGVPHAFTAEDFRQFAARAGLERPHDARAFGAVISRARRLHIIEPTGRFGPAVSSHGSPKPLYRAGPGAWDWRAAA